MGEQDYYEEPYEFQDAKRHARYFGWWIALAVVGFVLLREYQLGIKSSSLLLAIIIFVLAYGAAGAFVYALYFVMPVLFPPKDDNPSGGNPVSPKPRATLPLPDKPPVRDEMIGNRTQLVNRLVTLDSMLIEYQDEIRAARAAGNLERVTVNAITTSTSAKKWNDGNPAKQLWNELTAAGFIGADGEWTDTGNTYSLPHPAKQPQPVGKPPVATGWGDENYRLQPVGEY